MSAEEARPSAELSTVRIVDLPVALHLRAREHADGLQREFRLVREYLRQDPDTSVPVRLLELIRTLTGTYGSFTSAQQDALEQAAADGQESLTLVYQVPAAAGAAAGTLSALLDEADEFCREGGNLLTLASPPEVAAYRRWYLQQFTDQTTGKPPVPWPVAARGRGGNAPG